jgi:hypothetical protein
LEETKFNAPKILFKDAVRFLNAINIDYTCHFCGNGDFAISTTTEDYEVVDILALRSLSKTNSYQPFVTVHCVKCGTARTHVANVIVNWLRDNPEVSELSEPEDA